MNVNILFKIQIANYWKIIESGVVQGLGDDNNI